MGAIVRKSRIERTTGWACERAGDTSARVHCRNAHIALATDHVVTCAGTMAVQCRRNRSGATRISQTSKAQYDSTCQRLTPAVLAGAACRVASAGLCAAQLPAHLARAHGRPHTRLQSFSASRDHTGSNCPVASTSALVVPGSHALWPLSATMVTTACGIAWDNAKAEAGGHTMS